jgi:hypothetical protein
MGVFGFCVFVFLACFFFARACFFPQEPLVFACVRAFSFFLFCLLGSHTKIRTSGGACYTTRRKKKAPRPPRGRKGRESPALKWCPEVVPEITKKESKSGTVLRQRARACVCWRLGVHEQERQSGQPSRTCVHIKLSARAPKRARPLSPHPYPKHSSPSLVARSV